MPPWASQSLCAPLIAATRDIAAPPSSSSDAAEAEIAVRPVKTSTNGSSAAESTAQNGLRSALRAVVRLMLHGNSRPTHRPLLAALAQLQPPWLAILGLDISQLVRAIAATSLSLSSLGPMHGASSDVVMDAGNTFTPKLRGHAGAACGVQRGWRLCCSGIRSGLAGPCRRGFVSTCLPQRKQQFKICLQTHWQGNFVCAGSSASETRLKIFRLR